MNKRTEKEILSYLEHHLQKDINLRKLAIKDMNEMADAKKIYNEKLLINFAKGVLNTIHRLRTGII